MNSSVSETTVMRVAERARDVRGRRLSALFAVLAAAGVAIGFASGFLSVVVPSRGETVQAAPAQPIAAGPPTVSTCLADPRYGVTVSASAGANGDASGDAGASGDANAGDATQAGRSPQAAERSAAPGAAPAQVETPSSPGPASADQGPRPPAAQPPAVQHEPAQPFVVLRIGDLAEVHVG